MNNKELEQIHLDDLMADLASAIEQHGARKVLLEFGSRYPAVMYELNVQLTRINEKRVAALLKATS
jgi:hypothetical protein